MSRGARSLLLYMQVIVTACGAQPQDAPPPEPSPVATVRVAVVERREISEEICLFGRVTSGPAGHQTLSVPYESRVVQILVRPGQQLNGGKPVLQVEPSPDTRLVVSQARAAAESAHEQFQNVRQQFKAQLATNQQFEQAEQAARAADLHLRSLSSRGSTRSRELVASGPAVVASVNVSVGALVPAGSPLLVLDLREHREARFGVEVEDVHQIDMSAVLEVEDLGMPPTVHIKAPLRALSDSLDPQTHLVDLFATLPPDTPLILGQPITGILQIHSPPAIVVPRAALLPVEDHLVVFTIDRGHATAHTVRIGLESDSAVEVVGGELDAGAQVAVEGVVALQDGMQVQTEEP